MRSRAGTTPLEDLEGDRLSKFRHKPVDCFPVIWTRGDRSDRLFLFRVVSPPGQRLRRAHGRGAPDQMNCYFRILNASRSTAPSCSKLQLPGVSYAVLWAL
jgi:hypothetical protein